MNLSEINRKIENIWLKFKQMWNGTYIDAQLLEVQRGAQGGSWNFWEYYFESVLDFIRKSGEGLLFLLIFVIFLIKSFFKLSKFNPSPVFIHGGKGLQKATALSSTSTGKAL